MSEGKTGKKAEMLRLPFKWTPARTKAAVLYASGMLTLREIAVELDVSYYTVAGWSEHVDFKKRVGELALKAHEKASRVGIAHVGQRLHQKHIRWMKLQKVIDQRAQEESQRILEGGKPVPGMETGLVVKQLTTIGRGDAQREIEHYVVDTGLLAEMRALEMEVAKETGSIVERFALSAQTMDDEQLRNVMRTILQEAEALPQPAHEILDAEYKEQDADNSKI